MQIKSIIPFKQIIKVFKYILDQLKLLVILLFTADAAYDAGKKNQPKI